MCKFLFAFFYPLLFSCFLCVGQASYKLIQYSDVSDSSYYDIISLNEHVFWIAGKYGVLTSIDKKGNIQSVTYPTQHQHLLSMAKMGESIVIAADSGTIYFYNQNTLSWRTAQLADYKNLTFYHIEAINDSTALICGGSPSITYGYRAIPNGFMIKTTDSGKTWKQIYRSWSHMIWDIKYDSLTAISYAIAYSPLGSKIIESSDEGDTWNITCKQNQVLFHSFDHTSNSLLVVGGKNGNYDKNGRIGNMNNGKVSEHLSSTGMLWHIASNRLLSITSGRSCLMYKNVDANDWSLLSIDRPERLYKIAFIDESCAYVVGSNKLILQFYLENTTTQNEE